MDQIMCKAAMILLLMLPFVLVAGAAQCAAPVPLYGAEFNPTDNPIGGGAGYNRILLTGDFVVATADELLKALLQAKPGQVVYVAPDAEIDLSSQQSIRISEGVTLAGNRGYNGSAGPILFSNEMSTRPLFTTGGANVRITGLRLRGPDGETQESAYAAPNSMGVSAIHVGFEIDNCEVFNWSYVGIEVAGAANNGYVHHNYLHHIQRSGLGYPVQVSGAHAIIEANIIDWYRHAIAGPGTHGSGYEARYNIIGEHATNTGIDMHGGVNWCKSDCSDAEIQMAGDTIIIHHNTFLNVERRGIGIRGVPTKTLEVYGNRFMTADPWLAFTQDNYSGNATAYDNSYGPDGKVIDLWLEKSPIIRDCSKPGRSGPYPCDIHDDTLPIVGFVQGAAIKFGFSQLPKGTVRGILTINPEVDLADFAAVSAVKVLVDEGVIYSGASAHAADSLSVDTTKLVDGTHDLTLQVDLAKGTPIRQTVKFTVTNWWETLDDFEVPYESGWLGLVDTSKTVANSPNWGYATETPEQFGGDAVRRVRQALSSEYLVWKAQNLQQFNVKVFVKDTSLLSAIHTFVSTATDPETAAWKEMPYTAKLLQTCGNGWFYYELTGRVNEATALYKITISGDSAPDAIQLGSITMRGLLTK